MKLTPLAALLSGALLLSATPAKALGFLEAYRAALTSDPTYQAAIAENDAGQENIALGRAGLLPQISASGSRYKVKGDQEYPQQTLTGTRRVTNPLDYTSNSRVVQLRQTLLNWGSIAQYRQGKARAGYSGEIFRSKQQDLALRLSSSYFQVLLAQHSIELAEARRDTLNQQVKTTEKQFEAGDGTITDVDEARARFDLSAAQLIEARDQLTVALRSLREMVGETPLSLAVLKTELPLVSPAPDTLEAWIELALDSSPEIAAARQALEVAAREVDKSRGGHLPTVDLIAAYNKSQSETVTSINQDTTTRQVGLQVNIPIFSGGYTNALTNQAIANRQRATYELEAAVNRTQLEVTRQFSGTLSGIAKVQALQLAVASSEKAVHSTKMGFQAGMRTNVDILNAEEQLYQSRRNLAEAKYLYLLSSLRLRAAGGMLSEADMVAVDSFFGAERPVRPPKLGSTPDKSAGQKKSARVG